MSGLALVDTSIRVRHFRRPDRDLRALLEADRVLCHPLVLCEIACGSPPPPRERTLQDLVLGALRQAVSASSDEVLALIERERLFDRGCGAVDLALVASTLHTPGARLWTADQALLKFATHMGIAWRPLKG